MGSQSPRLHRRTLLRGLGVMATLLAASLSACSQQAPAGTTVQGQHATAQSPSISVASTSSGTSRLQVSRKQTLLRLTYFSAGSVKGVDYFAQNAHAFAAHTPHYRIAIEPGGSQYDDKILSQAAAGTPPDVILQGGRDFGLFVTKGVVQSLDGLIARDHYDLSDFFPICLQLTTWKKHVYGLPDDLNLLGLYYNKDLFNRAGIPHPPFTWDAPGWSWQIFAQTARKLTSQTGIPSFGADFGGTAPTNIATVLWAYGGDFLSADWTRCLLDQPPAIAAIQYLSDLMLRDRAIPNPAVPNQQSAPSFLNGRIAMHVAGAFFSNPASQTIKSFSWDAAALPSGSAGAFSVAGGTQGSSWSITAATKHREGAWRLTQWMASPQSLSVLTEHGWIGARRSIGLSPIYLDPHALPAHRKVFIDATKHVKMIPLIPNWADINKAITTGLMPIWKGQQTVRDACGAITQEVDALLKLLLPSER